MGGAATSVKGSAKQIVSGGGTRSEKNTSKIGGIKQIKSHDEVNYSSEISSSSKAKKNQMQYHMAATNIQPLYQGGGGGGN